LAKFENNRYEITDCLDECCFDREVTEHLRQHSKSDRCITQSVPIGEQFFFSIVLYHNQKHQETCDCIGTLEKDGDIFTLNILKIIGGDKLFPEDHHRFLITSYFPSKNFFSGEFYRSVLTSDGVITLEDNQMIGVKDGLIEELDVNEILDMLSKAKTGRSPSYRQVKFQPLRKRPARPSKGTIIYNEVADEFEVYGKNGWRKLKTEDIE
jgi:hypothetical protein